ncbi:hypothetical protein [Shewanella surugensis]|uniref:DUF1834 family protein n=1 Tax=Shewanella surugensis TaxID=212020 RepID=A0ABT0L8Y1_9GAMM|nr:hypothetical protein [Shewanella surugensis]MCL1124159.1 hypothetical protein [Shewanella surugensis]
MSNGIHLTAYHDAIKSWLTAELDWLQLVDVYPETATKLKTPCAFFSVLNFERADDQCMNGQLTVTLNCEILAVLGMVDEQYQLLVRRTAMAIALKVENSRFGLPIEPAVFISAEPDEFSPELNDYAVWSIRFNQDIDVGDDMFDVQNLLPHTLNVGITPEVGADHVDDYRQVIPDE